MRGNMKINVRVNTRAKRPGVQKSGGVYNVRVSTLPIEGRANQELIECLAEHFSVSKSRVKIVSGRAGRRKIVEILGE